MLDGHQDLNPYRVCVVITCPPGEMPKGMWFACILEDRLWGIRIKLREGIDLKCRVRFRLGDRPTLAEKKVTDFLAVDETVHTLWNLAGELLDVEKAKGEEALAKIRALAYQHPTDPLVLHHYGRCLAKHVRQTKKIGNLCGMMEPFSLWNSAVRRLDSQDYLKRVFLARHIPLRVNPAQGFEWGFLADLLIKIGRPKEAADAHQKAVQFQPHLTAVHSHLVPVLKEQDNGSEEGMFRQIPARVDIDETDASALNVPQELAEVRLLTKHKIQEDEVFFTLMRFGVRPSVARKAVVESGRFGHATCLVESFYCCSHFQHLLACQGIRASVRKI